MAVTLKRRIQANVCNKITQKLLNPPTKVKKTFTNNNFSDTQIYHVHCKIKLYFHTTQTLHTSKHTHTHTHNRLTAFVRDYVGRPVPEETFTHSHPSCSSDVLYQLPPSTTIHSILLVQFMHFKG